MNPSDQDRDDLINYASHGADGPTDANGGWGRWGEEALRKSEAEIFSILESITDAFFALDREWRFTYINSQAEVLFSRRREDLIGERIWEDATFYPQYRRAVSEGKTARFEAYYPKSGAWYSVRAYPSESGISVYLLDITDRKEAQQRLKENEERFRSLIDNSYDVITLLDAQGTILYQSPSVRRVLGDDPQEKIGKNIFEQDRVHREDLEKVRQAFAEVMANPGVPVRPQLLRDVKAALRESGIEARSLTLEITESAFVQHMETSTTLLKELRKEGIKFALDDFSSEYSPVSYLMRLPGDFVKIDKSIVWGLGEDPRAEVIVGAIISLAHSLGLEAVGEGVENAEQLEHLRRMGCDLVQGYHLARPLPPEEVQEYLGEERTSQISPKRGVATIAGYEDHNGDHEDMVILAETIGGKTTLS